MKVFIADNSAEVRESLKAILSENPSIEIIGEADNVSEAIKLIRELNPDVVILDIKMPDGSGLKVLTKIKQVERAPVVIMLTNYPYPQYKQKCEELGADFFFYKSNEFEKVAEVLKQLIQD